MKSFSFLSGVVLAWLITASDSVVLNMERYYCDTWDFYLVGDEE